MDHYIYWTNLQEGMQSYSRIFVEVDLNKKLQKTINLQDAEKLEEIQKNSEEGEQW